MPGEYWINQFTFTAMTPGTTDIALAHRDTDHPDANPQDTYRLTVHPLPPTTSAPGVPDTGEWGGSPPARAEEASRLAAEAQPQQRDDPVAPATDV